MSSPARPRVAVQQSRIGRGLFALKRFRAGGVLVQIHGTIRHYQYLLDHPGRIQDNAYRYGPETYLCPDDDIGAFANHSCEPNAFIRKDGRMLVMVARRTIAQGEEITFDYSTILAADDVWRMRCACGTPSCRGTIASYTKLPKLLREAYVREGLIPPFILRIRL